MSENVAQIAADQNAAVLIDLSSILYPLWHTTSNDPDPNKASQQTVSRVHALTTGFSHVAVCCDSGRTFRREIAETYKANRKPKEAPLMHQLALAEEQLRADGFPVWAVAGFEADDIIASAVTALRSGPAPVPVVIVTGDKDLLQLLGPGVVAKSVRDGGLMDVEAFVAKYHIQPGQMRDYLTLCGDSSDNIAGAKGIGPVKAVELLAKYGSLDRVFEELETVGGGAMGLPAAVSKSLREFKAEAFETTRKLVTLRTDVPLPLDELLKERQAPQVPFADAGDAEESSESALEEFVDAVRGAVEAPAAAPPAPAAPRPVENVSAPAAAAPAVMLPAVRRQEPESSSSPLVTIEYERALDPRDMRQAQSLALDMHQSRMFSAYGSPQAVLSTVMLGRELGLPAISSLRGVHVIEGKHSLSAQAMVAIILKSGLAEYFEPAVGPDGELLVNESSATYVTKRRGSRHEIRLTHTIEMARTAWPKGKAKDAKDLKQGELQEWELAFKASGWGRNPTDMLVSRVSSRLARMVYPDLLLGLYTPEEIAEFKVAGAGVAA